MKQHVSIISTSTCLSSSPSYRPTEYEALHCKATRVQSVQKMCKKFAQVFLETTHSPLIVDDNQDLLQKFLLLLSMVLVSVNGLLVRWFEETFKFSRFQVRELELFNSLF